jgi:hypothetical protein
VGAGVVAGEALAHHFLDGDRREHAQDQYSSGNQANSNPLQLAPDDDLGGNDFGINDSSSWDSGGGGSDWDDN